MLGKYISLQAGIKEKREFAAFVACVGYSLNLEGVHAAGSVMETKCSEMIQKVYNFKHNSVLPKSYGPIILI